MTTFDGIPATKKSDAPNLQIDDPLLVDMRGRMRNATNSYVGGFQIGQPLNGSGVSEVVDSKNASFPVGTIVTGSVGWEEYTVVSGAQGLRAIPNARNSKIPLSAHVGVLGMPVSYGTWKRGAMTYASRGHKVLTYPIFHTCSSRV